MAKRATLIVPSSTSELIKLSNELKSLQNERQKRERAKNDLLIYASLINIPSGPIREENPDEVEEFKPRKHLFGAHHLLWLDCLQKVEDGKIKRLMGLMPPGSAKSIYTSVVFPTHFMGRFRSSSIIVASYGSELPRKFGRRARSITQQDIYRRIFSTTLSEESKAADEWALQNGSEWMAAGILTGITGNRADGIIWDDLIKGREQADSDIIRNKTWDAYVDDLLTRKKPQAFEIGITCMVGSTKVLMSDGSHKNLCDIKRNDKVLSYHEGKIITSEVLNWRNCGPDNVFTIRTKSGTSVTANSKHPFLVERKGSIEWVRLKHLIVGDRVLKVIGASGKICNARSVSAPQRRADSVMSTMGNGDGERESDLHPTITSRSAMCAFVAATGSMALNTKQWLKSKKGFVQFAKRYLKQVIRLIGKQNYVSIIATSQEKSEGFCVTDAITLSGKEQMKICSVQPSNIYEIIPDEILAIEESSREDVFDVQIAGTENFIANGLISHNTRWHEDDVAGRILPEDYNGESGVIQCRDGNEWYVVCLPAEAERSDDILGRAKGEILWPEWFTKEMFAPFKRNPRTWSSLYQQRPAPDSGVLFKGEWLKSYEQDAKTGYPRNMEHGDLNVYGASDYAVTAEGGDYTVHIVVGVDHKNNIYVLDLWRKQVTSDQWVEAFCDLVKEWKPLGWAEERGQIKSGVGPFLTKRMRERQAYVSRADFPSVKSKRMRAQSIIGRMAQNGLYCPFGAEWFAEFRKELLLFDAGKHDDQVDALSLIGQVLDKMIAADISSQSKPVEKVFSTDPSKCTVTLDDMFEANEQRKTRTGSLRIH